MPLLTSLSEPTDDSPDAVRVCGRSMSREHLLQCANAVADRIRGIDRVAIAATPTVETIIGVVGALLAGVAVVPIPPGTPRSVLDMLLRESSAGLLLTGNGPPLACDLPVAPVDLTSRSSSTHAEPDPELAAMVLFTGGTTGAPKAVVVPRRAVAAQLDLLADAWSWTADDVVVHGLPLFQMHGLVLGVLGPLRLGARLTHVGTSALAAHAAAPGTMYLGAPRLWSRLCVEAPYAHALRGARLVASGGAPLPAATLQCMRTMATRSIVQYYGMTETLVTVSGRLDRDHRPDSVGIALTPTETRLAGPDGEPVPQDGVAVGELVVRGPTLFSGYGRLPDHAAALSPEGWFSTGDLAMITPDGRHRIIGRASTESIYTGGHRVSATEVESALLIHPGVRDAAVVGTPDRTLHEQVTAYVVADGVRAQQLADFVARRLGAHQRPRRVHLVDELPRTAFGAVQKHLLTALH